MADGILTIKIDGLEKLTAAFEKGPALVTQEMKAAIQRALILLQGAARIYVVKDTSNLGASIKTNMTSNLSGEVSTDVNYAIYVHEGTSPHFPPLDAIEPWAQRHGIPAFLVARSIAKNGTKANPFFKLAQEEKDQDVSGIFDLAISNICNKIFS